MATYSSILAWTIPRTEEPEGHGPWYTTKHTDTQTHRHTDTRTHAHTHTQQVSRGTV